MRLADAVVARLKCLIHGPQIRERILVRRVNADERTRMPPAFIIGVYRSGTTLLRYVLDCHSRIAVPPESVFLDPLADLWRTDWMWPNPRPCFAIRSRACYPCTPVRRGKGPPDLFLTRLTLAIAASLVLVPCQATHGRTLHPVQLPFLG